MSSVPHTTSENICTLMSRSSTTVRHFLIVTLDLKLGQTYMVSSVAPSTRKEPWPCHVQWLDHIDE